MRSGSLSLDAAQLLILIIGAIGMMVWLVSVLLCLLARKTAEQKPSERFIPNKSPQEVRDDMPRAAALQESTWDLIGGDQHGALFDVSPNPHFQTQVQVQPENNGCRVITNVLTIPKIRWQRWLLVIWLTLEPMVIISVGAALWIYLPNHSLVRGQAVQMVQIVHILWPPFLFWGMERKLTAQARRRQDRFLTTLELLSQ